MQPAVSQGDYRGSGVALSTPSAVHGRSDGRTVAVAIDPNSTVAQTALAVHEVAQPVQPSTPIPDDEALQRLASSWRSRCWRRIQNHHCEIVSAVAVVAIVVVVIIFACAPDPWTML